MGEREREKKNERTGAIVSVVVHGAAVVAMILIAGWKAPNPPLPEYGIELNFGLADAGTGEVQPEEVPDATEPSEEQVSNEPEEQAEETPDREANAESVTEAVVSKVEGPVVIKEKEEEKDPVKPKEVPRELPKPKVESQEPVKEELLAVYEPSGKTDKKDTDGKTASQGDAKDKLGDQGDPPGMPDADGLSGKPGGGDGGQVVNLEGWKLEEEIRPDIPTAERGTVVFNFWVDESGVVTRVLKYQSNVSDGVTEALRRGVFKLRFSYRRDGDTPTESRGTITYTVTPKD